MLKIAVCDDEREQCRQMQEYLREFETLFQVDVYESGEALLNGGDHYDIIFLDIDMKGISGIDTARILRKKDKKVKLIYVTAYEDFREYAFAVHAFGYLVKPVSRGKIQKVLREALEYTEEETPDQIVRFDTEQGLLELGVKDIYYFEFSNRKIRMVTKAGDIWMRGNIGALGERMISYGFGVPHKSFVVNLYHIKNLKGYEITMTDGGMLPLSQKKSAAFREHFVSWLAQQI